MNRTLIMLGLVLVLAGCGGQTAARSAPLAKPQPTRTPHPTFTPTPPPLDLLILYTTDVEGHLEPCG
ncbi:MAG TPA: hypothetical protein EYP49_04255 [Anaerolineae bacterium]|nr:hypothetical protein [Anaerolineae bacterium]